MERAIGDFVEVVSYWNQKVCRGKILEFYEFDEKVLLYSEYQVPVEPVLHKSKNLNILIKNFKKHGCSVKNLDILAHLFFRSNKFKKYFK